jgi:hypothetical protein
VAKREFLSHLLIAKPRPSEKHFFAGIAIPLITVAKLPETDYLGLLGLFRAFGLTLRSLGARH